MEPNVASGVDASLYPVAVLIDELRPCPTSLLSSPLRPPHPPSPPLHSGLLRMCLCSLPSLLPQLPVSTFRVPSCPLCSPSLFASLPWVAVSEFSRPQPLVSTVLALPLPSLFSFSVRTSPLFCPLSWPHASVDVHWAWLSCARGFPTRSCFIGVEP